MATTIATKFTTKTLAPAAAPKTLTKGDTIKLPLDGDNQNTPTTGSKKTTVLKGARSSKGSSTATQGKDLSPDEASRFAELHKLVRTGLQKMNQLRLQVAAALLEIRDNKLYRDGYKTFEAFCKAELNLLKAHAYALAKAGEVYRDLESAMADKSKLPANERQMRPLTRMKVPEQRTKVWVRAVELAKDKKPTEVHVRKAISEIVPSRKKKSPTLPPPLPDATWRDRVLTGFIDRGYEATFEQPIKWLSDAVALHSPTVGYYVKPVGILDFTEAACVVALGEKRIPCLIMVDATANSPDGIIFSTGEQPPIGKESFPVEFHVMAKALDAVLEIDGTFYKAGELDESFRTAWAPVSYLDLELPAPTPDSNADATGGE